jgi:hypothetical protein
MCISTNIWETGFEIKESIALKHDLEHNRF